MLENDSNGARKSERKKHEPKRLEYYAPGRAVTNAVSVPQTKTEHGSHPCINQRPVPRPRPRRKASGELNQSLKIDQGEVQNHRDDHISRLRNEGNIPDHYAGGQQEQQQQYPWLNQWHQQYESALQQQDGLWQTQQQHQQQHDLQFSHQFWPTLHQHQHQYFFTCFHKHIHKYCPQILFTQFFLH